MTNTPMTKEKLFYCKNNTVGMNKKDFPAKPKDKQLIAEVKGK